VRRGGLGNSDRSSDEIIERFVGLIREEGLKGGSKGIEVDRDGVDRTVGVGWCG